MGKNKNEISKSKVSKFQSKTSSSYSSKKTEHDTSIFINNGSDYPSMKAIIICASISGLLNMYHVSSMFENDRHFSHLSNLEREMSFRTEMGFYYYFYKVIVESESFVGGINRLINENRTEYPNSINALQRFNLLPEVVLGGSYRAFKSVLAAWDIALPQTCYQVSRGDSAPPVVSCEGIGQPIYWYLSGVWTCAGVTAAMLFVSGTQLSGSLLGGLVTVACFFFNHGEATRVQWTPPLRESFAFPLSLMLNVAITNSLRVDKASWSQPLFFGNSAMLFLLSWQFSQYVLCASIGILYCMYTIGISSPLPMLLSLLGSLYAFANTLIAQFFNPALVVSSLSSVLLGVLLLNVFMEPLIQMIPHPLNTSTQLAFFFISALASKLELSHFFSIQDDDHLYNLIRAKFSNYSDFHTGLYTCAKEFDFLPKDTINQYMDTFLLPCVLICLFLFFVQVFSIVKRNFIKRMEEGIKERAKTPVWTGVDAGVVYNLCLLIVYAAMAGLFMRLKLFLTPHMCVIASLTASKYTFRYLRKREFQLGFVFLLLSLMSVKGIRNISHQRSISGEYSDLNFEELLDWINSDLGPEASFAGPMPTMANVLLSTRQPIVNHPHYENVGMRERTKLVYSLFSRRSVKDVHETLVRLKVSYVILQRSWCLLKSKPGCGMVDLWDKEEPVYANRPPLCPKLFHHESPPFHRVFSNDDYVVLQVPTKVVELKVPRSHVA